MTFPTLTWTDAGAVPGGQTSDGRFALQRDNVRGEGVCYTLWVPRGTVESRLADALDIETAYYGTGGKARAKAAARRIARARYLLEQTEAEAIGWRDRGGRRSYRLWLSQSRYTTGITEDMACLVLAGLAKPWTGYGSMSRGAVEITPAGRRVLGVD